MSASEWKPYPNYNNIESKWIGDIPAHWKLKKIKQIGVLTGGAGFPEKFQGIDNEVLSFHKVNALSESDREGYIIKKSNTISFETASKLGANIFPRDTIVFAKVGAALLLKRFMLLSEPCCIDNNMIGIEIDKTTNNVSYIRHYLGLIDFKEIVNPGAVPSVNATQIGNISLGLPQSDEQKAISKFIDSKVTVIDDIISKSQKLLQMLDLKRASVITQVVTKGMNPNVKMKESGIGWIGKIPEHWGTRKVKHLFQLKNEPSNASHDMELLSIYTAIGVRPRKSLEQKGNKATSIDGYWIVKKEDLIINKLLAWMGAIGRSEYDGVTSPAYDILRPLSNTISEYYHFLFRCGICLPEFKKRSRGIMEMRLRLYFEELGSIEVPYPPPREQQEIADYIRSLDDRQIDLEASLNAQIKNLDRFRTSLISAAVTGKIDVRSF